MAEISKELENKIIEAIKYTKLGFKYPNIPVVSKMLKNKAFGKLNKIVDEEVQKGLKDLDLFSME